MSRNGRKNLKFTFETWKPAFDIKNDILKRRYK